MDKNQIREHLLKNSWFEGLPNNASNKIVEMAVVKNLSSGEYLYAKGDAPNGIYGVIKGALRISTCSPTGKLVVYAILGEGSWMGEISMFDNQTRIDDAIAQGETQVLHIPSQKFHAMLDKSPELYKHFIKLVCAHYRLVHYMLEDNSFRNHQERLAKQLIFLAESYGVPHKKGIKIDLRLPQELLGMMVGTTRQRINTQLKEWEKLGWISVEYSNIIVLDKSALENTVKII